MSCILWGTFAGISAFAALTLWFMFMAGKGVDDASAAHMAEMLEEAQARNMELHDRLDAILDKASELEQRTHVHTWVSDLKAGRGMICTACGETTLIYGDREPPVYANPREQTHGSEGAATAGQFDPDEYKDLHDGERNTKPTKPT